MKRMFFVLAILFVGTLYGYGQEHGIWVDYDTGKQASYSYLQAVGGNVLIYYPAINTDTVYAFDTYSHQWHMHHFRMSETSSNAFAGENGAMVWNDSVLVLYDALHGAFHELKFEGEILHQGTAPFNVPGSIGSLTYLVTTKKAYVFDHDRQTWSTYGYTHPGLGNSFTYTANGKRDYVMITVTSQSTSEPLLIAFSKSRHIFEEISSINLEWKILDHGFACWVNGGIPESEYFFTVYSADNGFFEKIKPNRAFDAIVNENDPIAESTVFMATYYIPHASSPGGTRYNYATDTRNGAFWSNHFEEDNSFAKDRINVGYKAGILTTTNASDYEILAHFYDGETNNTINTGRSALHSNTPEHGYFAGSSYFTGYDTYHFIFNNRTQGHLHTIELPAPTEGYQNPTYFRINADWGIALCQRALTDQINIYSFNTRSDFVQSITEPVYSYDFDAIKAKYYYYGSSAYNDPKKILVYAPTSDSWATLPLAQESKWFFGEDFVCTYNKSDGNLKIHDVPANHDLAFPLGWQTTYDYDRHTYGREKFFIGANSDNHYFAFSAYTRDIKEVAANFFNKPTSKPEACMVALAAYGRDLLAYNAKSNSFIPLHLSDEQGNAYLTLVGDSTLLVVTQNGHLLAFDPNPEATSIDIPAASNRTLPREFSLAPVYPNPFNPVATISFTIAQRSRVEISVYNAAGQMVQRIWNGLKPVGTYRIKWDASHLASGMYFIEMKARNFHSIRKAVLMK